MKRTLKALSLFGILVLVASSAEAQARGGARGKVLDDQGNPVSEATVQIQYTEGGGSNFEVTSNEKGEYIQIGLQPGRYRFTASKEGYANAVLDIRVTIGGLTSIPDLQLIPQQGTAGPNAELIKEKFTEGVELAKSGQLDEAEAVFKEILELSPGIPEVYRNLGYVYSQREDWDSAEESYQSALDLRPGDPNFVAALAEIYRKTGREEEAMALLEETAADNPEDAQSQFNRGLFLLDAGQNDEAQAAFEAALAADPELAEAHYHLGTILVGQGKVAESVEHLELYLAANPDNEQFTATAEGLIAALKK